MNHKNGVKSDNRITNLEYVTPSENDLHAVRMGLKPIGERHGMAKITEKQARGIKRLLRSISVSEISKRMNITYSIVSAISYGRTWKHI